MSSGQLGAALVACVAGYGVHLLYTGTAHGWTGIAPGHGTKRARMAAVGPRIRTAAARPVAAGLAGAAAAFVLFGAPVPALVGGRVRRGDRRDLDSRRGGAPIGAGCRRVAHGVGGDARAGGRGRPAPSSHALFHAGRRTPTAVSVGFAAAEREWHSSTDFGRALGVLKTELAEASTDVICETLLVAHQVGGTGVERRLEALIEDRVRELDLRRDAGSRQAGARFARQASCSWCPSGWRSWGCRWARDGPLYQGRGAQITVAVALATHRGVLGVGQPASFASLGQSGCSREPNRGRTRPRRVGGDDARPRGTRWARRVSIARRLTTGGPRATRHDPADRGPAGAIGIQVARALGVRDDFDAIDPRPHSTRRDRGAPASPGRLVRRRSRLRSAHRSGRRARRRVSRCSSHSLRLAVGSSSSSTASPWRRTHGGDGSRPSSRSSPSSSRCSLGAGSHSDPRSDASSIGAAARARRTFAACSRWGQGLTVNAALAEWSALRRRAGRRSSGGDPRARPRNDRSGAVSCQRKRQRCDASATATSSASSSGATSRCGSPSRVGRARARGDPARHPLLRCDAAVRPILITLRRTMTRSNGTHPTRRRHHDRARRSHWHRVVRPTTARGCHLVRDRRARDGTAGCPDVGRVQGLFADASARTSTQVGQIGS